MDIQERQQIAQALGLPPEEIPTEVGRPPETPQERPELAPRMSVARPIRRTPQHASTTAMAAAIAEGTEDNFVFNEQAALNGRTSPAIADTVNKYRNEVRGRPAELSDLTPEGVARLDRTLNTWEYGVTEALVTEATRLPAVVQHDPNMISINHLRRGNAPLISEGMFQEWVELDDAKHRVLLENPPREGIFARSPEDMGTFLNTFMGVAQEFVPGRGVFDFFQWARTAKEAGIMDSWLDVVIGGTLHGWTNEKIRRHMTTLSNEDQIKFMKDFMQKYESKAGVVGSNWHLWTMLEGITNEEFLRTMDPVDRMDWWLSNVASVAALFEATALGFIIVKGMKTAKGAHELLWRSNPSRGRANLQHLTTRLRNEEFAKRWGLDKIDVIQSQLPGPEIDPVLRNLPDGILKEVDLERTADALSTADDISRRANASMYTSGERVGIIKQVAEDAESMHKGTLRPSMSRLALMDDESGVRFTLTVGKDEAHGFGALDEAWAYAERFTDPSGMSFLRLGEDGSTLAPFKPKVVPDGKGGYKPAPGQVGEFFVQLKHDHYFSPMDAALFGGDPVVAGTWMGRGMRYLTTPSAHMHEDIYRKFTLAFTREQALVNALDYITAPLFRNLSPVDRNKVNDIMVWAEDFGKINGKNPDLLDIKAQFPEFKDNVLGGYYQTRIFHDTLHKINNDRVYRAWHGQGYKTARKGGTAYHGEVLTYEKVKRMGREGAVVLDAETGKSVTLDGKALAQAYENNSVLMRLDLPMEAAETGALHKLVLMDASKGWRVGELSTTPLKYVPGYFSRIYKDNHFIRRIQEGAVIDGKPDRHTSVMQVAATRREADVRRGLEVNRLGRKLYGSAWDDGAPDSLKEARLAEKGYKIEVADDARLSAVDREAMDMGQFQMEGRLFFDNRNAQPLTDVYGNPAEVVNPINTIQRVGRMAARQIAFEDLIKQQKRQFFARYGDTIPELRALEDSNTREVSVMLSRRISETRGADAKRASEAKAWWDYIRTMEGSMTGDVSAFRKAVLNAAEWFDLNVGWKFGGERGRAWTKDLSRYAHNVEPFGGLKSLAFLHFITARPLRQLFLQGGQHLSIQAIDPSYFGRLQMDAFSLLTGMRLLGRNREGRKLLVLKNKQAARQMGYSKEEFDILMNEFSISGLVDSVDVHSYAGGIPKSAAYTPETTTGMVAQGVADAVKLPFQKMRAYGFDMGEQYNVTTSWLMALRRHKVENKITDLRKMTREDWDAVASRGSNYALAMHRSNAAQWQYGAVSVPLQFLQFSHKWLLTMLGGSKKMRDLGLSNRAFTLEESRKIVAGQVLLFGASGFALKELWQKEAHKRNLPLNDAQIDLLASGTLDYMVDKLIQTLADDPDLDFAIADGFSPGQGWGQTLRSVQEAAFGNKHLEFLVGPGGMAASRIWQAAKTIHTVSGGMIEGMTEPERAQAVLEAAAGGLLSSGSDYLRVKMAQKMGYWTNQHGVSLGPGFEAKYAELVMKGAFGVNPQRLLDLYQTNNAIINMEQDIRKDAREAYNHVQRIVSLWGDGIHSHQEVLSMINQAVAALAVYDEPEQAMFLEEFYSLIKSAKTENEDIFVRVADILMRGGHPDFVQGVLGSGMFDDEQRGLVREMLEDSINEHAAWREREEARLWEEKDIIRGLPNVRP